MCCYVYRAHKKPRFRCTPEAKSIFIVNDDLYVVLNSTCTHTFGYNGTDRSPVVGVCFAIRKKTINRFHVPIDFVFYLRFVSTQKFSTTDVVDTSWLEISIYTFTPRYKRALEICVENRNISMTVFFVCWHDDSVKSVCLHCVRVTYKRWTRFVLHAMNTAVVEKPYTCKWWNETR